MKTTSFFKLTLAMAGLTLGIVSCEEDTQTTTAISSTTKIPEKIISLNKAASEYNNFYETRIAPFEGKSAVNENRAIWFDLQTLENYLQKIETVTQEKGIQMISLGFILAADSDNKRTVVLAPMAMNPVSGINSAFSIDNGQITFLHGKTTDNHSTVAGTSNTNESLLLSSNGFISSTDAIKMYNNYYDTKLVPISHLVANDSRICFYEKGVFTEYLEYIKKQATENKIALSGINIAFGVYDNDPSLGEYANHQTLFFTPTSSSTKSNTKQSYSIHGNQSIEINFNQNTFNKIYDKSNEPNESSVANELAGSPPNPQL